MLANHAEVVMHDLAAGQHCRLRFTAALQCSQVNETWPCASTMALPVTMSANAKSACGCIAGLLVELERLMLTSGTASVSMNTFLDSAPEFQAAVGAASALEAMSSRLYNDDVRPQ